MRLPQRLLFCPSKSLNDAVMDLCKGGGLNHQAARKWGDGSSENMVLDYSEKVDGATAASTDGASKLDTAMADLSLKSRVDAEDEIDDDEDETEEDVGDEGARLRLSHSL